MLKAFKLLNVHFKICEIFRLTSSVRGGGAWDGDWGGDIGGGKCKLHKESIGIWTQDLITINTAVK